MGGLDSFDRGCAAAGSESTPQTTRATLQPELSRNFPFGPGAFKSEETRDDSGSQLTIATRVGMSVRAGTRIWSLELEPALVIQVRVVSGAPLPLSGSWSGATRRQTTQGAGCSLYG
jgi:hypothetical protein